MLTLLIQLVPMIVVSLLFVLIPFTIVFRRIGRSRWWAAIALVPFGIFILPWMVALMRWQTPMSRGKAEQIFR